MAERRKLSNTLRLRIVAAAMLVVSALVLFTSDRVTEKIEKKAALAEIQSRPLLQQVNEVVDTLLNRYQIDPKWVTSWNVFSRNRKFIRRERRVQVPPHFISLDFNHDLNNELAKLDARVVATERTKEMTVSMHIIHGGMVIESIRFVLNRDLK